MTEPINADTNLASTVVTKKGVIQTGSMFTRIAKYFGVPVLVVTAVAVAVGVGVVWLLFRPLFTSLWALVTGATKTATTIFSSFTSLIKV